MVKQNFAGISALFLTLLLLSAACKTKKSMVDIKRNQDERVDKKNPRTLMKLLKENQFDFNWLSAKFSANMVLDGNNESFNGVMRIRKDSVIWIIISKMGFEGARVMITKDSVKFLDKVNKKYFTGTYDTVSKMLHTDLDFEIMQSMLVGNSVEFYEEDEKLWSGKDRDSAQYILSTIRKRKLKRVLKGNEVPKELVQSIWLENKLWKITRIFMTDHNTNRTFDAFYNDFQKTDYALFPFHVKFNIEAERSVRIEFDYSKVILNKPQEFPFTVPESYERIVKKN